MIDVERLRHTMLITRSLKPYWSLQQNLVLGSFATMLASLKLEQLFQPKPCSTSQCRFSVLFFGHGGLFLLEGNPGNP